MTGDLIFYKYNSGDYYKQASYTTIDGESIGVHIGKDTVGALFAPAPMKADLTNVTRTENGSRFFTVPYVGERSVTLNFVVTGATRSAHNTNLSALLAILYKGHFAVKIPSRSNDVYFLNYQSSSSYSVTRRGCSSKLAVKCIEYKPTVRTMQASPIEPRT